jgi:hypothetical protein
MFAIIAWVVGGVAILAMIHGFDVSRQNIGRDRQKAEDAPIIQAAEKARDTAVNANLRLQNDLRALDAERQLCSSQVDRMLAQAARLRAAQSARKPADDKRLGEITAEQGELVAALGLPDPGGTCEQKLARRDAVLKRLAEQRVRDFPKGPPPKSDDIQIRPTK